MAAKNTEKDQFVFLSIPPELIAPQQLDARSVSRNQELLLPDWHEATVVTVQSFAQPFRIFTTLSAAVYECSGEYILVFVDHIDSVRESGADLCLDLAGGAGTPIQRVGVLHVASAAQLAGSKIEFVVVRNAV